MAIPPYKELCNPILKVLHSHGGIMSIRELERAVADMLNLTDAERNEMNSQKTKTRLSYRVAWARYYLKKLDLLARSKPGVCSLSEKGTHTFNISA